MTPSFMAIVHWPILLSWQANCFELANSFELAGQLFWVGQFFWVGISIDLVDNGWQLIMVDNSRVDVLEGVDVPPLSFGWVWSTVLPRSALQSTTYDWTFIRPWLNFHPELSSVRNLGEESWLHYWSRVKHEAGFPPTWKVRESQGKSGNLGGQGKSGKSQGILDGVREKEEKTRNK